MGFDNIDRLVGPAGPTLCGPDVPNTWEITGTNAGNLISQFPDGTVIVPFSGFTNLLGGAVSDEFVFFVPGNITGLIDGRLGPDTLTYTAVPDVVNVKLTNIGPNPADDGYQGTAPRIGSGFFNISQVKGNSNPANTLTGANRNTGWRITDVNTGQLTDVADQTKIFLFSGFPNLFGGTADDFFTLTSAS